MPTIVFGDNTGDDYSGAIDDNKILEVNPTTNYDTGVLGVGHFAAGAPDRSGRTIIKFAVNSQLSTLGATSVTSGILTLECSYADDATGYAISAYRALLAWVESQSTWNIYATSNNWNTAGAQANSDATGEDSTADRRTTAETSTVVAATGTFTWDITTAVEAWRAATWSEYGVVLISAGDDTANSAREFTQVEGSDGQRPYLTVTYSVATSGLTAGSLSLMGVGI